MTKAFDDQIIREIIEKIPDLIDRVYPLLMIRDHSPEMTYLAREILKNLDD